MLKKAIAEFIGTCILVFIGTATAVLGDGIPVVGILGIAMAFGLALMAMCYSIGTISGCHINPAVSISMFINKRINIAQLIYYIIAQVLGGILGSTLLFIILKSSSLPLDKFGQNTFGYFGAFSSFFTEFILSFIFILVILVVTGKHGNANVGGLIIGLTLAAVHLVGIPFTGTSVNPARSIGPAIFAGGGALSELWVFILAPIIGGILASIISITILDTEKN